MSRRKHFINWGLGVVVLGIGAAAIWATLDRRTLESIALPGRALTLQPIALEAQIPSDPFVGGVAWLNVSGPITLKELKGKVVLLDFWTYCCINCHHILPDLERLEAKYPNELVVIGVHTPKFFAEQDTRNIRKKIHEYQIKHPVVNDANMEIWNRFGVNSWPTTVLIDPEGKVLGGVSGEGNHDLLDRVIGEVVAKAKTKGTLDQTPVKFFPEIEKPHERPLLFPGKVLADAKGGRLFISDTGHNRIVVTDLEGKNPIVIGNGGSGLADGGFEKATFHRPQGMTLIGDTLYVADTENHAIRAVDLIAKAVTTLAGDGSQANRDPREKFVGPAKGTALNSPWDLTYVPGKPELLYIAMAGPHQIWTLDLKKNEVARFAGTGRENITDGPADAAAFAQPSGLATDGKSLFVADSEVSAVRAIDLKDPAHPVRSIVGEGLFEFGDKDGEGTEVRLQHCLGLSYDEGRLYLADTYNNKVKVVDPESRGVQSLYGDGKPGESDDPARFYQPGGLSASGDRLYVADTNNQAVRVIDLKTKMVGTVDLSALKQPAPKARKPAFVNATKTTLPMAKVAPGPEVVLDVHIPLAKGFKLNLDSPLPYLVEAPAHPGLLASSVSETGERLDPPAGAFSVTVPLAKPSQVGDKFELKLSVQSFVCNEGSNLCMIKSYVWTLPVIVAEGGESKVAIGE